MIRKHFRLKRIALGLAFAAVLTAFLAPTASARVASEMSVQSGVTPIQADGLRYKAMADRYQEMAAASRPVASEMSVQSSYTPAQAEALRWEAMAKFYKDNQPGITSAGTAIANQKHDAYPVPVSVTSSVGSDNFSWSDAGIGASAVFAGLLVLLTVVGLGRRQRSRGLASA
jgi:hypothetical protein